MTHLTCIPFLFGVAPSVLAHWVAGDWKSGMGWGSRIAIRVHGTRMMWADAGRVESRRVTIIVVSSRHTGDYGWPFGGSTQCLIRHLAVDISGVPWYVDTQVNVVEKRTPKPRVKWRLL